MKIAIVELIEILAKPKKTLIGLPSDKITLSSLVIVLLAIASSILQELQLINQYKFNWSIFLPTIIEAILYFIAGASILFTILLIIRKQLSFCKIFNVLSVSQTPRLFFSIPIFFLYLLIPELKEHVGFNKTLNLLMLLIYVYSFFLLIFGLVINIKIKNITTV
jgi:hypothetical protein